MSKDSDVWDPVFRVDSENISTGISGSSESFCDASENFKAIIMTETRLKTNKNCL